MTAGGGWSSLDDESNHWAFGLVELARAVGQPLPMDPTQQATIAAKMQQQIRNIGPETDCAETDCPGVAFGDEVSLYKLPDDEWYVCIGRARCRHGTSTELGAMLRVEKRA